MPIASQRLHSAPLCFAMFANIGHQDALLSTTMTHRMEPYAIVARPATSANPHSLPAASALIGDASKALKLAGSHEGPLVEHLFRILILGKLLRLALWTEGHAAVMVKEGDGGSTPGQGRRQSPPARRPPSGLPPGARPRGTAPQWPLRCQ